MRWRSNHEVPKSRLMPRLAKMAEKRARSEHTVRSHASDEPEAGSDGDAVDPGDGRDRTAVHRDHGVAEHAHARELVAHRPALLPPPAAPLPLRSAPAQKSVPPPVRTMTRVPE